VTHAPTKAALAKILSVSRQTLFTYLKRPDCPQSLDVAEWTEYVARVRTHMPAGKRKPTRFEFKDDDGIGSDDDVEGELDFNYERARRTKYLADLDKIKRDAARRYVVMKQEVIDLLATIGATVRSKLLRLEGDMPSALVGRTEAEIQKIVRQKVEEALSLLAIPDSFFTPASDV
jgi:hypothetical protein